MRFAHAMIQVRDLERAVTFYRQVLGLAVSDRHAYEGARIAYLASGDGQFELELLAPDVWPFGKTGPAGRSHLAFTVGDLEGERRRLSALGVACEAITSHVANGTFQTRYFYIHDPEDNEIEFLEPLGRYGKEGEGS